jgi:DNA-binding transcriptional ArsR family regulator
MPSAGGAQALCWEDATKTRNRLLRELRDFVTPRRVLTHKQMLIRIAPMTTTEARDVFRAVADPTRRALLDRLRDVEQSVTDLAGPFRMTQPAISQHLRILRRARLVRVRQVGRQRVYRLNAQPLRQVFDWASRYRTLFTDPAGHAWRLSKPRSDSWQSKAHGPKTDA